MNWAMELSPSGFAEMLADLDCLDRKTGRAFLAMCGYLRRFGSVPSGERALASVLGVTVRFLQEVTWPLLEVRLELSEDGKRFFDPEITGARSPRSASPVKEKSKQHQQAAEAGWAQRRARKAAQTQAPAHDPAHKMDASAHAPTHAKRMRSDAQTHVFSMRGASETHAENAAFASPGASPDASDASAELCAPARAPTPSPLESSLISFTSSPAEKTESVGERGDARDAAHDASDASAHASMHAKRMRSDAPPHAPPHAPAARRGRPIPPPTQPIPADWVPSSEGEREARKRGYVGEALEELVVTFRDHYAGNGEVKADWNAVFRNWCRRQTRYDAERRQGHMTMAVPGGVAAAPAKPEPEPDPASFVGDSLEARWARVQRNLKAQLGPALFRTWFKGRATLVGLIDGEVVLAWPSDFHCNFVRKHYGEQLTALWRAQHPEITGVNLSVARAERRSASG